MQIHNYFIVSIGKYVELQSHFKEFSRTKQAHDQQQEKSHKRVQVTKQFKSIPTFPPPKPVNGEDNLNSLRQSLQKRNRTRWL